MAGLRGGSGAVFRGRARAVCSQRGHPRVLKMDSASASRRSAWPLAWLGLLLLLTLVSAAYVYGLKLDWSAASAGLRERAWDHGLLAAALVLCVALFIRSARRHRQAQRLEQELTLERERQVLAARIVQLTRHANDIILLHDQDLRITRRQRPRRGDLRLQPRGTPAHDGARPAGPGRGR